MFPDIYIYIYIISLEREIEFLIVGTCLFRLWSSVFPPRRRDNIDVSMKHATSALKVDKMLGPTVKRTSGIAKM